jgi:hypothetical protein
MHASAPGQQWGVTASDSTNGRESQVDRPAAAEGSSAAGRGYSLCFHSFVDKTCAYAFPCDAAGRVDIDALSEKARHDYLYARTVIGRLFRRPAVLPH